MLLDERNHNNHIDHNFYHKTFHDVSYHINTHYGSFMTRSGLFL